MSITSVEYRASVQTAIAAASRKTGIDFDYLLGQAQVESGMRADARAGTSSASGLYQFIDQSWLGVVKQHGAEHGLGWAADSISRTSSGRYVVSDAGTRQAILNLRSDPQTAALMAAEHAADNKAALEGSLDRPATGTDLYMAHFLGLGGARSFLGAMQDNPDRIGASMFPAAARANRGIFYASNGQPRSLGQIYERLSGKLDRGAASAGATGLASDGLGDSGDGNEVILGNGAVGGDRHWVQNTLAQLNAGSQRDAVNPLRPTPETARLAYLMLANLGA
ncbi:lytic transglycosylase domain-containing protein [Sphingomonas sp. dw_22]|uniref:lytic transglycosylase domain-containing protein n=1 Tax=Sphingomonas sp. dw_22 TaxID=2721175 RepID=UPI001BD5EA1C|nr:lytic transglycosylase domain-containing protein [Sphingomonas sp. dw_22]